MATLTDFLGNEYGAGDIIVYAQARDRSINMIKAKVIEIKENGNVRVQPMGGSRWKGHSGKSYSVDNRTGKRIDPWAASGKHVEIPAHYVDQSGKVYPSEEYYALNWEARRSLKVFYVPTKFKDYVESRSEDTKSVTLTVTKNIVKISDGQESPED